MPSLNLSEWPRQYWPPILQAIMLCPGTPEDFYDTLEDCILRLLRGHAKPLDPLMNYIALNRTRFESGEILQGPLCGMMLVYTMARKEAGEFPASINHTLDTFAGPNPAEQGIIQSTFGRGSSRRQLRNIWERYAPVSHFWAMQVGCSLSETIWASSSRTDDWFAKAEDLRRRAESYQPSRSTTSVLDPSKTWRLHEDMPLPQAEFPLPVPDTILSEINGLKTARQAI